MNKVKNIFLLSVILSHSLAIGMLSQLSRRALIQRPRTPIRTSIARSTPKTYQSPFGAGQRTYASPMYDPKNMPKSFGYSLKSYIPGTTENLIEKSFSELYNEPVSEQMSIQSLHSFENLISQTRYTYNPINRKMGRNQPSLYTKKLINLLLYPTQQNFDYMERLRYLGALFYMEEIQELFANKDSVGVRFILDQAQKLSMINENSTFDTIKKHAQELVKWYWFFNANNLGVLIKIVGETLQINWNGLLNISWIELDSSIKNRPIKSIPLDQVCGFMKVPLMGTKLSIKGARLMEYIVDSGLLKQPFNQTKSPQSVVKAITSLLDIPENASDKQIRNKFRQVSKQLHPDRLPKHLSPSERIKMEEKYKAITSAFDDYDNMLKEQKAKE